MSENVPKGRQRVAGGGAAARLATGYPLRRLRRRALLSLVLRSPNAAR
jgi:hypothetical protein